MMARDGAARRSGAGGSCTGAVRVAMWSGPRNISTALMRSWGSRDDTVVCDEPLYAHFLTRVDVDHPAREEVIASQETDWRKVVNTLVHEPLPEGRHVFYQKHMAHHLLPEMNREWIRDLTNAFLIRDPREMLTSLVQVTPRPTVEDTGLPQQVQLYDELSRHTDQLLPVIDARDVLENPREVLASLCNAVGVCFDESMLSWQAGPRETDGVWAPYWYAAVEQSSGFQPYRPKSEKVPVHLATVYESCIELYNVLHAKRLVA